MKRAPRDTTAKLLPPHFLTSRATREWWIALRGRITYLGAYWRWDGAVNGDGRPIARLSRGKGHIYVVRAIYEDNGAELLPGMWLRRRKTCTHGSLCVAPACHEPYLPKTQLSFAAIVQRAQPEPEALPASDKYDIDTSLYDPIAAHEVAKMIADEHARGPQEKRSAATVAYYERQARDWHWREEWNHFQEAQDLYAGGTFDDREAAYKVHRERLLDELRAQQIAEGDLPRTWPDTDPAVMERLVAMVKPSAPLTPPSLFVFEDDEP